MQKTQTIKHQNNNVPEINLNFDKTENRMYNIIDIKATLIFSGFLTIQFSQVEIGMKIVTFLITVGYMVRRWYLLEKNKGE